MKAEKKHLSILEEIDGRATNNGLCENLWAIQVAVEAEKAGIPADLIDAYINGDLVVINGEAYNLQGEKIKI